MLYNSINPLKDKMPYKKPLRKKGVRETVFAHTVKLCWFHIKFEDINNKISLKKFCEDFENIVIIGGIWERVLSEYNIDCDLYKEDGSIHKPDYKKLFSKKGWINQYEWKEQYPIFKSDMLMSTEATEREKYLRYMVKLNQEDYELMNTCHEKEREYRKREEETGKDMTYYRNKNNETKSQTDERLRKRNGFDKTKVEFEGNVKADVEHKMTAETKARKLIELRERMEKMAYD